MSSCRAFSAEFGGSERSVRKNCLRLAAGVFLVVCTCPADRLAADSPSKRHPRAQPAFPRSDRKNRTVDFCPRRKHRQPLDRGTSGRGDDLGSRTRQGREGAAREADPHRRVSAAVGVPPGARAELPGAQRDQRAADQLRHRTQSGGDLLRSVDVAQRPYAVAAAVAWAAAFSGASRQRRRDLSPGSAAGQSDAAQPVRSVAGGLSCLRTRRSRSGDQRQLENELHVARRRGGDLRLERESRRPDVIRS